MSRTTNVLAGLLLAPVLAQTVAFAQSQSAPQYPEDALVVRQLVAWSRFQKPQPAPQPLPPRDTPVPQPDQQDKQGKQPVDPEAPPQQTPITQSFTGKIVKDGNKYVLKVARDTSYDLQDQGDLSQYENQNVKVVGTLDTATNSIRVQKIELIS